MTSGPTSAYSPEPYQVKRFLIGSITSQVPEKPLGVTKASPAR